MVVALGGAGKFVQIRQRPGQARASFAGWQSQQAGRQSLTAATALARYGRFSWEKPATLARPERTM